MANPSLSLQGGVCLLELRYNSANEEGTRLVARFEEFIHPMRR